MADPEETSGSPSRATRKPRPSGRTPVPGPDAPAEPDAAAGPDASAGSEESAAPPARRARPWESEEAAFALLVRVVIGAVTLIVIVKGVEALI